MRCSCLLATILVAVSTNPICADAVAAAPQDEDDAFSIEASVDRDRITVGDRFLYRITVKSPGSAAIEWPESGRPPDGFELVSFEHEGPLIGPGGGNIDSLRYVLTLFQTGAHSIPPLSLKCMLPDGTELSAVSEAIPVTVVSVIDDDAADIRDLKDPVEIPGETLWYWWIVGGLALLAVAAAIVLYIRHRRNREFLQDTAPEIARPPEEVALEELDRLAHRAWLDRGRVNAHYSALSEILRRYLSARYGIAAMEYTTSELMVAMRALDLRDEEARTVRVLFEECDMVKFAKHTPESHRQSLSLQEGRDIVELTRPADVSEPSAGPAPDEPVDDDSSVAGEASGSDAGAVRAPSKD